MTSHRSSNVTVFRRSRLPGVSAGEPGADIDAERERGPIRRDLFASDERAGDACNADGSGDLRPPDGEGVRWRE